MSADPLNGPLEVGLRALAILSSAFPRSYDLGSLAFFDYSILHSDEFGGPESLHPAVPHHRSEIAVKRDLLEHGLQVMIRAKLIALQVQQDGIGYMATDNAPGFVDLLESDYMHDLKRRAEWVIEAFGGVEPDELRTLISELSGWPADRSIGETSPPEWGQGP